MTYKYNIDDEINNFKIKDRYVNDKKEKRYKVECLKCHNISDKVEKRIIKTGCSYCNGHSFIKGYNDVATVRPDLIPYFKNTEDAKQVSLGTTKRMNLKCPICGYEFSCNRLRTIADKTWKCPKCGRRGSFNERIMKALLNYYHIDFIPEKTFEWAKPYRYDIFIPKYRCIVELHGLQHYEETPFDTTLEDRQYNDDCKMLLAKDNNYKYVVIDCRKSTYEWFFNSLKQTKLCNILGIDYNNILHNKDNIIYNNMLYDINKCIELYKQGYGANEISKRTIYPTASVSQFLRIANDKGFIVYNDKTIEDMRKRKASESIHKYHTKHIICLENKKIYDTYYDAQSDTGCTRTRISACCNKKAYYTVDKNNNKFHWLFLEEYNSLDAEQISNIINFKQKYINGYIKGTAEKYRRKFICLETKSIYCRYDIAANENNSSYSGISNCCNHKRGRKYTINKNTRQKLHWLFLDEYEKMTENEILRYMNNN